MAERTSQKNYLGIDWGFTDIGVALAHAETGVALTFATLRNDKKLFEYLEKILSGENIGTVVIGIPSYINRAEAEYPGEIFGTTLKHLFPDVNVVYQNEMFTTKMAQANLIERGEKAVDKHDDEEAARIILQEWLDTGGNERKVRQHI